MGKGYDIKWYGEMFYSEARKSYIDALLRAALVVERYVKTHFSTAGVFGMRSNLKTRRRLKKKRIPSSPGQPPAVDLGSLRASITHDVITDAIVPHALVGSDTGKLTAEVSKRKRGAKVGTSLDYGYYLEYGTRRMAARPYLRPALLACRGKIMRIMKSVAK